MPGKSNHYGFLLAVGLPVVLFGITYLVFGFYYETNDDQLITFLLRGITIQPALSNLSIYFYGWSGFLVQLYQWLPAVPWYGLILYTLLLGATVIAFNSVQRAASFLKLNFLLLVLLLFFVSSWLEHVMWFNYMRVPFLLAGTAFLFLTQRAADKNSHLNYVLTGLIFLAALCIRPSAALLGVVLVGPAVILFANGKQFKFTHFKPLFYFGTLAGLFLLFLRLYQTPAVKEYQRLDWLKSTIIDFQIYQAKPVNLPDSLALEAVAHWLLADTQVINERFYQRAGSPNLAYIIFKAAPPKLAALAGILIRDQFLVLALNGLLLFYLFTRLKHQSNFVRPFLIGYQVYFWLIILVLGVFLKLPPRIITPALSLYSLVHLVLFFRELAASKINFRIGKPIWVVFVLLTGLQFYKISHRAYLQQKQKQTHEAFIAAVKYSFKNKILVSAVFQDYLRSLSPFGQYDFGSNTVFLLTGWSTLDPGFKAYFRKFSGNPDFATTVAALARQPNCVWLLPPDFSRFLNNYFTLFYQQPLPLQIWPHPLAKKYNLIIYQATTYKNKN